MSIFYEGQEVGCLVYGEGIITSFLSEEKNSFYIKFKDSKGVYYQNGRFENIARPTLYPIEQYRAIIANLPAPEPEKWQPKKGDWCWFWDNNYQFAVLAQFSSYDAVSSYRYQTNDGASYQHCAPFTGELPPHLKDENNSSKDEDS